MALDLDSSGLDPGPPLISSFDMAGPASVYNDDLGAPLILDWEYDHPPPSIEVSGSRHENPSLVPMLTPWF